MKKPRAEQAGPPLTRGLRRFLFLTAACTGAAIMIIEILGAKMLAPYFGTSHFVWTAQIGVTLVALSAGYAAGGRLADAAPRLRGIYAAILLGAAWVCGAVLTCEPAAYFCLQFKLAWGSLLASALLFFVPLALLAMVGPFLARVLTSQVETVGRTIGQLTAISTLGSVAGTVLIGYVVIPLLPNSMSMYLTAAALCALVLSYFIGWERSRVASIGAFAGLAAFLGYIGAVRPILAEQGGFRELHRGNSNFGLLQVVENETGDRRYFLNDLLMQNSYDPKAHESVSLFTHMLYGLARAYAPDAQSALCIGLGVGIVPLQLARDGLRVEVVEINPAVVPLAERYFEFDPSRVRLTLGDGRPFLTRTTNRYDVVVLDAFLGESPPSHLMTREAFATIRRCLAPDGVLVMNAFGEFDAGKDFLVASLARTLAEVFPSQRIHAAGNGNVFFVASTRANLAMLRAPDLESVPATVRAWAEAAFESRPVIDPSRGRVLTDDFNPVEFHDAANREELRRRLALSYRPN